MSTSRTDITITFTIDGLSEDQIRQISAKICSHYSDQEVPPENVTGFDFATLASSGSIPSIDWEITHEEWTTIKE